jgi:Na+-driven multidrug efflux pump
MGIGAFIGVFIALIAFFYGANISSIFSNDPLVIAKSAEYLRGFSAEAIVTSVLFSFMGYFNGHGKTVFVMAQGLAQSFIVRLPMSYYMSVLPDTNLTLIGLAAPSATVFGIVLCLTYYLIVFKFNKRNKDYSKNTII